MLRKTLVVAALLGLSACRPPVHWSTVPYHSDVLEQEDPVAVLERLLLRDRELAPISVDMTRSGIVFYFFQGPPSLLNFGEITAMELLFASELGHYDVDVKSPRGTLYRYAAPNQEKAKAFIDALTAVKAQPGLLPNRAFKAWVQ
jgi:hypothetical protein